MKHNNMNEPDKTLKSVAARKCIESTETKGDNMTPRTRTRYQKYEFCDTIDCPGMRNGKCQVKQEDCIRTAKEFHHWLSDNGFEIVKSIESA